MNKDRIDRIRESSQLTDQESVYLELLSRRKEQQEELQRKIAEAGKEYNMIYLASCYGVSVDAVRTYWEKNKKYPLLYYVETDKEVDIVRELNMIDRLLKIKKLRYVQ